MIDEKSLEEKIIAKAFEDAINYFPKADDHTNYVIGMLATCVAKLQTKLEKIDHENI